MPYTPSFVAALNHAMLYEVGPWWNIDAPGARDGLIDTKEHRRACGYVNDPSDSGGETKYGIAKNANPDLNITKLNWDAANRIYYRRYWLPGDCESMNARLAALHFDSCVQHGIGRAAKFVQQAVGADVDGDIGPQTLGLVEAVDVFQLCDAICDARSLFYHAIVTARPDQIKFLGGWLRRIDEMRKFVLDPDRSFE